MQVKKSLCVLIQHHLVTHQMKGKQSAIYRVDMDSVMLRVHFPRWMYIAKSLFGDAGEAIVEGILQQGHAPMNQVTLHNMSPLISYANIRGWVQRSEVAIQ